MRLCPCCSKPVALQECCPIGKIPPVEWGVEDLCIFLGGIKTDQHKWVRFGGLGDLVDATLGEGGYKELFRKEKLVGKVLFGKTRKTLSDLFKRIGVRNVKHRDLLVESIHDLGRQQEPLSEEQSMQERFVLVRNSWTDKRRPEIQLQALADLYQETQDPAKLASLKTLGICALLRDVLAGQMQDLELEKQLVERQLEIDGLWERRRNRELDYMQKKELDRTEHLQAKDWVQWKADFGSLAVVGFLIVQNLSASPIFRPELTSGDFPTLMAVQLDKCREAETHVNLLRMSQAARGPFVPLVVSEVAEQQLTVLTAVLHLSKEEAGRVALVEQGVAVAVVKVARAASVRDSAREVVAVRILCNLSLTNGNTERTMVQQGCLVPLVRLIREGVGQLLYYAITTLANLAFVQENRDDILAAGALGPLKELLRRGDPEQVLKTIDTIRNLAAARADLKLARATVPDLTAMVLDEADKFGAEHKLRAMIALRSISRFEESLEHLERNGTLRMAANIARDSLDPRLRSQALGLLYNVAGLSAQPPLDPEEEDFTDEEDDDEEMAPDDEDAAEAEAAGGGGAEAEGEGEGASGEAGEGEGGMAGGAAAEEGRSPGSGKDDGGKPIKRANHVLQRRTSPFFKLLTERELQLLALKGTYLDLEKGEVLVMQGDSTDRMFAVVRGIMRVLITMGGTKLPLRTRESKLEKLLKSQKKSEGSAAGSSSPAVSRSQSPQGLGGRSSSPKGRTDRSPMPSSDARAGVATDDNGRMVSNILSPHTEGGGDAKSSEGRGVSPFRRPSGSDGPSRSTRGGEGGGSSQGGSSDRRPSASGSFMSSSQWTSHESKASRPMLATALKIEKGIKEVARLRAGDSGCELCILDGRKSSATVFAMTACTVLEITDELLCEIMSRREELKDALTPNQKLQSVSERLKVYWNHESLADEAAERINMLRIEAGERRLKVSQHLVSIGVVTVFEKLVNEESKETNQTLAKAGLGLMVGAEKREEKLLEVTDGTVECLKAMIDATRFDEEWHGHRYNFATVLLSARLLVLNDKNKRKFAQNAMIPFVLSLLKDDDEDVVRLATAILLELSFAMRARWLVRPVLTIWRNYVGDENQGRDALSHQPPMTDMVDLAAPTYTVKEQPLSLEPSYSHQVFEAAGEGGMKWLERLVEEEGFAVHMTDDYGATALHYAAINSRLEIMQWLVTEGVGVNLEDSAGCTPLAWLIMARNVESGKDKKLWSKEAQAAHAWLVKQGAVARYLPMFPATV